MRNVNNIKANAKDVTERWGVESYRNYGLERVSKTGIGEKGGWNTTKVGVNRICKGIVFVNRMGSTRS